MLTITKLFWGLCTFRAHPAYLPTASWFVAAIVGLNLVVSVLLSLLLGSGEAMSVVTRILVAQASTAALLWGAVMLKQVPERFPAALTAAFGCDLLITAVFAVCKAIAGPNLSDSATQSVALLFFVWAVAVLGYVLHKVLEIPLLLGVVVSLGMAITSIAATGTVAQ